MGRQRLWLFGRCTMSAIAAWIAALDSFLPTAASQGSSVTVPPAIWLATATLGVSVAILALSSVPARAEARRRPVEVLQSEVS